MRPSVAPISHQPVCFDSALISAGRGSTAVVAA
jgi:hypothetical protein